MTLRTYIDELASRGRMHFTTDEATRASGASPAATRVQPRRLRAKAIRAHDLQPEFTVARRRLRGDRHLAVVEVTTEWARSA